MTDYNAYGEAYDRRPEMIIHDRLKQSGATRELIDIAKELNYKISFSRGPFRQDLLLDEGMESNEKKTSHTLHTALRYFNRRKGWS